MIINLEMSETLCLLLNAETQSIFDTASQQADKIKGITYGFLVAAAAIMLLVIILTTYIAVKYREGKMSGEPRQITGNRQLELLMVGVPLVLVIIFFFWMLNTMNSVLPDRVNQKPDIIITGHQWWWQAYYPDSKVSTANEIHLPVGKQILMQLNAGDVIHDWWVPALGGKMDMIPGINNYLWVTITKSGIYEGSCSEFCGQQHAWMRILVIAQSQADYYKWLVKNTDKANSPKDTLTKVGEALFMKASCSSCHSIQGTIANGMEGPNLTHFASRKTMLTGMMDNNSVNISKWLTDPQNVKPGAHMPRFIFDKDSVRALTAYLTQLK